MVEEISRRRAMQLMAVMGGSAAAVTSLDDGDDGGGLLPVGGDPVMTENVTETIRFVVAEDSQDYQDAAPGEPTVFFVKAGPYQGIQYHDP